MMDRNDMSRRRLRPLGGLRQPQRRFKLAGACPTRVAYQARAAQTFDQLVPVAESNGARLPMSTGEPDFAALVDRQLLRQPIII